MEHPGGALTLAVEGRGFGLGARTRAPLSPVISTPAERFSKWTRPARTQLPAPFPVGPRLLDSARSLLLIDGVQQLLGRFCLGGLGVAHHDILENSLRDAQSTGLVMLQRDAQAGGDELGVHLVIAQPLGGVGKAHGAGLGCAGGSTAFRGDDSLPIRGHEVPGSPFRRVGLDPHLLNLD